MRVTCNSCGHKFDVPIRAVLIEAERIHNRKPKIILPRADGCEPDGNVLSEHDLDAKRQRELAIARRLGSKKI